MNARVREIRVYRLLSACAVLHSALVAAALGNLSRLSAFFEGRSGGGSFNVSSYYADAMWVGLATLLFFWPIALGLHRGRSIIRFSIPIVAMAALFAPCAH